MFYSNGTFIKHFQNSNLNRPDGICIDQSESFIIADSGNQRLSRFSLQGEFVNHIDSFSNAGISLHCPAGIAIDQKGDLFVCDMCANQIVILHTYY